MVNTRLDTPLKYSYNGLDVLWLTYGPETRHSLDTSAQAHSLTHSGTQPHRSLSELSLSELSLSELASER
jgi:hypothetical protein